VFCDKRTRLSIQNYDASVLEGLTWFSSFSMDAVPQISES
jgi:hypothetical protein